MALKYQSKQSAGAITRDHCLISKQTKKLLRRIRQQGRILQSKIQKFFFPSYVMVAEDSRGFIYAKKVEGYCIEGG